MESKKKQFFFKFPQLKKANKKAGVKQGKKLAHRRSISFPDLRNLPESTSMTSLASVASPGPGSSYHSDNDSIASGNIPGGEHLPPPDRAPHHPAPPARLSAHTLFFHRGIHYHTDTRRWVRNLTAICLQASISGTAETTESGSGGPRGPRRRVSQHTRGLSALNPSKWAPARALFN